VPYVGTVVNGIVHAGSIKKGDAIMIGPDGNGNFLTTSIKDMQRKRWVQPPRYEVAVLMISRAPVSVAEAGQCVSFALKRVKRAEIRKGMVITAKTDIPPRGTMH
jgi:GTPase